MIKIKMIGKTEKQDGVIHVRFRLVDGRRADISHKSDIRASAEELEKFENDGTLKPKAKRYNQDLADRIEREIALMREAYKELLENGYDLTAANLDRRIQEKVNPIQAERDKGDTLLALFKNYADSSLRDGIIGANRHKHIMVVWGKLERFLIISGQRRITAREFDAEKLWAFRNFIYDEYLYVERYPKLYKDFTPKNLPTARLGMNTAVSQMKMFQAFFNSLDPDVIDRSPFEALGRDRKKLIMKTLYDAPVYLTADEFQTLLNADIPEWLRDTRDAFLLQCAFGCRIADFQALTMDNVDVSEDGIPFIHYLPNKTKMSQDYNLEIVTPIVLFALEIIKRTRFNLKETKYPSGANGYNVKIKSLLKVCGIDRKVPIFNEETGKNEYQPIWELGSSKLARKTHVDMMTKVQLNPYLAGLHKAGSTAVFRYTDIDLKTQFALMNAAFGQEPYAVDKYLNKL